MAAAPPRKSPRPLFVLQLQPPCAAACLIRCAHAACLSPMTVHRFLRFYPERELDQLLEQVQCRPPGSWAPLCGQRGLHGQSRANVQPPRRPHLAAESAR
jgi:hypothetical protein